MTQPFLTQSTTCPVGLPTDPQKLMAVRARFQESIRSRQVEIRRGLAQLDAELKELQRLDQVLNASVRRISLTANRIASSRHPQIEQQTLNIQHGQHKLIEAKWSRQASKVTALRDDVARAVTDLKRLEKELQAIPVPLVTPDEVPTVKADRNPGKSLKQHQAEQRRKLETLDRLTPGVGKHRHMIGPAAVITAATVAVKEMRGKPITADEWHRWIKVANAIDDAVMKGAKDSARIHNLQAAPAN